MSNKYDLLESVIIVTHPKGAVATMRFKDGIGDKIISSPQKSRLYLVVERHIKKVINARTATDNISVS